MKISLQNIVKLPSETELTVEVTVKQMGNSIYVLAKRSDSTNTWNLLCLDEYGIFRYPCVEPNLGFPLNKDGHIQLAKEGY